MVVYQSGGTLSITISPRHAAARAYAQVGIPVFPCRVNGKEPACAHGFKDATIDLDQIDAWWKEGDYNVAFEPDQAGWAVLDVEAEAIESMAELGCPQTYVVQTPRGGYHLYFTGSIPSKVRPFGRELAVDIRGKGGYVLIPPSTVAGQSYSVAENRSLAAFPQGLRDRIRNSNQRLGAVLESFERDTPTNHARARSYLAGEIERGNVATAGHGGNNQTYRTIAWLRDLGLSPATSRTLLIEPGGWNEHCQPPWSPEELDTLLNNTYTYAQNSPGIDAVASIEETFPADTLARITAASAEDNYQYTFPLEDENEQDQAPDPEWLIPGLLLKRSVAFFIGETGHFKSYLLLDISLGLAHGVPTFQKLSGNKALVVYVAGEGGNGVKKARRQAWKLARQINGNSDNFLVCSIAPMLTPEGEQFEKFCQDIEHKTKGRKPALIVFDTLSCVIAGQKEDGSDVASLFTRMAQKFISRYGCTIAVAHHKSDKQGASAYRGSSGWKANADTFIEITANRSTRAVEVWVTKHKDAPEPLHPWTFEGRTIIANGREELVFYPTTAKEHEALMHGKEVFTHDLVTTALQNLGATTAAPIPTHILATELTHSLNGETPEARQQAIERTGRALEHLAAKSGPLSCFSSEKGKWRY